MGRPVKRAARHTRVKLEASAAAWRPKALTLQRQVTNLRKLVNALYGELADRAQDGRPGARRGNRDRPRHAPAPSVCVQHRFPRAG